jgi:uncharacterized membrane protein
MQFVYTYVVTLVIFALFDFVWLRVLARNLYRSYIGHLMGPVRWGGVFAFYLLFLLGLTFFAVNPAVTAANAWYALILGALFGFFTYATYDLTNYATLKHWPLPLTIIDIVWGVLVCAVSSWLAFLIVSALV